MPFFLQLRLRKIWIYIKDMFRKKNNFTCEIRCKKHDGRNDVCKTDVMRIKTKVGDVYMVAEQW